jgi:DNA repair exonuclease SbcCD ATPase subunit
MCPARVGLPNKPIVVPPEIGNKANFIEQIRNECAKIKRDNDEYRAKIEKYEQDSIKMIKQYRAEIDERSSKTHETIHQIEDLYEERNEVIAKLRSDNEKAKKQVYEEDAEVCREIEEYKAQLEVIRKFEEDRPSIQEDIELKEQSIEQEKRSHEAAVETTKKTTQDLLERNAKQNEETLEKEKEAYYDHLLRTTDQAILLHIQRRHNYENDLLSLRDMYQDYTAKIESRKEGNERLRETIESLRSKELIDRSADQRHTIAELRSEVNSAKDALKALQAKTKKDIESGEAQRKEETRKVELALKLQQDQLDHKLQQIASLRELTLTVLSYRSQLEAEFITVLGETIYDVAQRENPGQKFVQSTATRKLSLSSSSSDTSVRGDTLKRKELSINHTLAQFTLDDRYAVLQKFMDRVHGEVEANDRLMSPLLNDDGEPPVKPTSV